MSFRLRIAAAVVLAVSGVARAAEPAPKVDFNREIRPIHAGKCFACHGPDEKNRKAGLRLDLRDVATKPSRSGATAIAPGKPDDSEVVERIGTEDAEAVMPPPRGNKVLKPAEKALLTRWIAEGAEYKEHWAFRAPVAPPLPAVKDAKWPRGPIDAFVLDRLEKAGLRPSPEADRATLIRRLSLDLVGLPPTIAEVDAFLADARPDAYEQLVDRLLASPHYGERWARRWLDRARYADTNGYEKDRERSIWPYRDWVIAALNADMPFDRFTVEQIAGDMLPGATEAQKVATGFHRNTMINEEGGIDIEEFRFASLVDRVAATGTVWLGLTVQCAQCHTHKFDPITQREYYQFLALMNNADEPDLDLVRADIKDRRDAIEAKAATLEAAIADKFPEPEKSAPWQVLQPLSATSARGATLTVQKGGAILASGPAPEVDTYTVVVETALADLTALRLDVLTDPGLPSNGPGRAPNGNFVVSGIRVEAAPIKGDAKPFPITLKWAVADFSQAEYDVKGAIDDDPKTGWAIDDGTGHLNRDRWATFGVTGKSGFPGGTRLTVTIDQAFGGQHTLGRFRLSAQPPAAVPAPKPPTGESRRKHLSARLAEWEAQAAPVAWTALEPSRVVSKKHATMTVQADRSVLVGGDKPNNDTYEVEFPTTLEGITALRLEVLPDPSLPDGGPGRAPLFSVGDFLLSELEVSAAPLSETAEPVKVPLGEASQDYSEAGHPAALAVDGINDTGWTIKGGTGRPHAAVFTLKERVGDGKGKGEGTKLLLTLHMDGIHQTTIGKFRVSATTAEGPVKASGLPAEVEEILLVPAAGRTEAQRAKVERHFLAVAPELAGPNAEIAALRATSPKYPTSMVMKERDPANARATQVRTRGEFLKVAESVEPGVPAILHGLPPDAPRNRLALARWLVAAENPLVGRVAMNEAWLAFFGRGLVATAEDFGTRGDEPSHPELLDWLATEFPRRGWSLKAMHRLIATSATYRQASKVPPALLERDPKNVLLARGARFRVEAETVRDIALTAAGLLSRTIGGPSVYPPQPEGVTALAYGGGGWPTSGGADRYRRGLYTFTKRTAPYAAFTTFDAPSSELACVRRERSNTPLQALTLLNDAVFVEAARALARRALAEGGPTTDDRVRFAFRACLARPPGVDESKMLADFLERQLARFRAGEADAGKVAGVDPKAPDAAVVAAWTTLARAILNLDETISRE